MDKVANSKRKYVFGNWKMNGTQDLVVRVSKALGYTLRECPNVETVICPPFPFLDKAQRTMQSMEWTLGAQDVSNEADGAMTGFVSARMLAEMGCRYCLVGHSESRRFGGVTSADIVKKIKQLASYDITPVLCVGETRQQRNAGDPEGVVLKQVDQVLSSLEASSLRERLLVAYEPVWAIGSGVDDVAQQIGQITRSIKRHLERELPNPILLFGGSVSDGNIQQVAKLQGVDGVLVGGASLKPESVAVICKALQERVLDELRLTLD